MRLPLRGGRAMHDAVSRRHAHVVVGVDFSRVSLANAAWAARHFATTADLTLIHVVPDHPQPVGDRLWVVRPGVRSALAEAHHRELRGALRGLASMGGDARIDVEVRTGDPATELAAHADSVEADLIVVGATATSPLFAAHGAATTERLLRRTARPVLIARDLQSSSEAPVLAAVDGDRHAPAVLRAAWMLAQPRDGRIAALRVIDGELSPHSLARMEDWLRRAGVPRERSMSLVATGDVVRSIHRTARELGAGVVAVGTRSGDPAATNGDVGRSIVRSAHYSVLVVPLIERVDRSPAA